MQAAQDENLASPLGQERDLAVQREPKLLCLDPIARRRHGSRQLGERFRASLVGALTAMLADRVISGDPAQERADRPAGTPLGAAIPQLAERALRDVFGGVLGAGESIDVVDDQGPMLSESELERIGVVALEPAQQFLVGDLLLRGQRKRRAKRGVLTPQERAHG